MPTRSVEPGRFALITSDPCVGKICIISHIVDQKRVVLLAYHWFYKAHATRQAIVPRRLQGENPVWRKREDLEGSDHEGEHDIVGEGNAR